MGFLILSVLIVTHLVAVSPLDTSSIPFQVIGHRSSNWPLMSTMLRNYPLDRNHAFIDRAGLPTWLYDTNTCAMRVSYALIQSGYTIDIRPGEFNCAGVRATRKHNKPKYIIRVRTMRLYLDNRKGPADIVSPYRQAFSGKKGIIVFEDCPSFRTATGHVDLYDGSNCKGRCYFTRCHNIRLFELN